MTKSAVQRWLIVADDLTGAADCGVAFARRGAASIVGWGDTAAAHAADVLVYDADSRGLNPAAAARCHHDLLTALLDPGRRLFKKIDSTLRGQPAAEIAAMLALLRTRQPSAFGIVAPAYPATGRTTVDGRVQLGGRPLEDSELWRRDHSYAGADLVRILTQAGVAVTLAPLSVVREATALGALFQAASAAGGVVVCDAETDGDLQRIAQAGLAAPAAPLFIGSAGLAHALAALMPVQAPAPFAFPPIGGGTLLVVGSPAAISRAGARKLAAEGQVIHLTAPPRMLLADDEADRRQLGLRVAEHLAAGADVLVEIEAAEPLDLSLAPDLARSLAEALAPAAPRMGALAVTGGETAAALLRRLGVDGVRLVDQVETGVPLGLTLGKISVPIATKAGAFGDEDTLGRIAACLARLRTERTWA